MKKVIHCPQANRDNQISLLSDTEHHGIEILLPGPCLMLRYRK